MSAASIRTLLPELTRAFMALVLAVAMVAASLVVPAGHASSDTAGAVSAAMTFDDGSQAVPDHAAAGCHGCLVHAGVVLSSPAFQSLARVTDIDLVAANDASPPMSVRAPPVEPPRA